MPPVRAPANAAGLCEFCSGVHQTLLCPLFQKFIRLQADGRLPEQHIQVMESAVELKLQLMVGMSQYPNFRSFVSNVLKDQYGLNEKPEVPEEDYDEEERPEVEDEIYSEVEEEDDLPLDETPADIQVEDINVQRMDEEDIRDRTQRMGHALVSLETESVVALVDSASTISTVSLDYLETVFPQKVNEIIPISSAIVSIGGDKDLLGIVRMTMRIGNRGWIFPFMVVDTSMYKILLGVNFLDQCTQGVWIEAKTHEATFKFPEQEMIGSP